MKASCIITIAAVCTNALASDDFDVLQHLGANSPWFAGPNIHDISADVPSGCTVDRAVYIIRHGSRYPDPGAYAEWRSLYTHLSSVNFTASNLLSFMPSWEPVLTAPSQQIAQISPGGYGELYDLGVELRTRYPDFYAYDAPFHLWSNDYARTIDSARLFARGFLGPNATSLGTLYAVNSTAPSAVGNSLATSDACPTFKDTSGGEYASTWDDIYLPPITKRLNALIHGNLTLTDSQVAIFPYLCGFESQILRKRSPFCDVFTEEEILQYEYRQDLRYWYGTGPGAANNASVMLPVLQGVVEALKTTSVAANNGSTSLPPLLVAFTHDNQINELVSSTGIFDDQRPLSATEIDADRTYVSSRINPMRGTVAFEKLTCTTAATRYGTGNQTENAYVRVRLNDAVYPIAGCDDGPGRSCGLMEYADIVQAKYDAVGGFAELCELDEDVVTQSAQGGVTFFSDLALDSLRKVAP